MKSRLTKEMKAVLAIREGRAGPMYNAKKAVNNALYWLRLGERHSISPDPHLLDEIVEKAAFLRTLLEGRARR